MVHIKPVAGDQVYVFAPVAFNVADEPAHIVLSVPPLIIGCGLTVTVTLAVLVHPFASVPDPVYIVVVVGLAVGLAQLVHDKPVAGDQMYVLAPVAFNAADDPAHITLLAPPLTVGLGLTVTVTLAVPAQPLVPVTLKVVVTVGLAVGLAQLVHDKPVAGDHV